MQYTIPKVIDAVG